MNKLTNFIKQITIQDIAAFIIGTGLTFAIIAILPILYIFLVVGGVVLIMNQRVLNGGWATFVMILLTIFWPVPMVGIAVALFVRTHR